MIIRAQKKELQRAIRTVMSAIPGKTTMDILTCILIDATVDQIKFTATDTELGIETVVSGEIDERGLARLTQRNKFSVGETIEIMKPDGRNIPVTVEAIYNEEGEAMESAPHAQQRIYVKLTEMPEVFDILRRGE